jgi:hypothetical protein
MFNYFLYFTGILIGIFLILIIISDKGYLKTLFKNSNEYFNNNTDINSINNIIYEKIDIIKPTFLKEVPVTTTGNNYDTNVISSNSDIIDNFNFLKLLRRKDLKVLISSYNKENININNLEWITDNKDYNNNIILKLSSDDITKELYSLNPLINGYNILNVSIDGPSNDIIYSNDKTINKFSILFMFMYKKFMNNNNNLFIIYGVDNKNIVINIRENKYSNEYYNVNITNDTNDLNNSYDTHDIDNSVNLLNNYHYYDNYDILNKTKEQKSYKLSYSDKLYTIEIIIDDSIYNINNINMEKLKDDVIFLGLIMNIDDVVFYLNNFKYEFKRRSASEIKIGKNPFIINKNKNCNIVLYSFAYFNNSISEKDLNLFKHYNKYKLHGVDNKKDYTINEDIVSCK